MSISGIQGLPLEVTVVGCYKLDDKEWLSRQDPYVYLEYGGTRFRTKTNTDGGRNPTFQEKFIFTLIEGLQELRISVWNNRTLSADEHIGTGRVQLHKALHQGYDDASWPLQSKTGRHSGEVRLIIRFIKYQDPSTPQYATPPPGLNPAMPCPAPTAYVGYPPNPAAYPPPPYHQMPPSGYPPQPCPPGGYPVQHYPPPPHPSSYYYPPAVYPPPPSHGMYPPPPSHGMYPPHPSSGVYPPPPAF